MSDIENMIFLLCEVKWYEELGVKWCGSKRVCVGGDLYGALYFSLETFQTIHHTKWHVHIIIKHGVYLFKYLIFGVYLIKNP